MLNLFTVKQEIVVRYDLHIYQGMQAVFLCKVTVKVVEETDNWWYTSCISCGEEALKVEAKFKCLVCPKCYPVSQKR